MIDYPRYMTYERGIQSGGWEEDNRIPPFSRAEQLIQAHPDLTVMRDMVGDISIIQTFPDKWRHIAVAVEHEKASQGYYPTVHIQAYETQPHHYPVDDVVLDIRRHGLTTVVKLHVENDEQVTTEVGYKERLRYPREFSAHYIRYLERYSSPIQAQELVTSARTGLEMLKAYQEGSQFQQHRIDNLSTGCHGFSQIVDGARPDIGSYIAEASPLLSDVMRRAGISYTHVGTRSIYALNVINKVTDAMRSQEMPPAPPNRREARQRPTHE